MAFSGSPKASRASPGTPLGRSRGAADTSRDAPGTSLERPEWIEDDFDAIWGVPSGTQDHFLVDFGINFRVRFCSDFDRSSIHAGRNLIGWGAHLYRFIPSADQSPWSNFLIKIDAQICDLCFLSFTFMFQASFRSPTKIHDQICDLGFLSFSFLVQAPFRSPPMDIGGS